MCGSSLVVHGVRNLAFNRREQVLLHAAARTVIGNAGITYRRIVC